MEKHKHEKTLQHFMIFPLALCMTLVMGWFFLGILFPTCLWSWQRENYNPEFPLPANAEFLNSYALLTDNSGNYSVNNMSQEELRGFFESELEMNCRVDIEYNRVRCNGRLTSLARIYITIRPTNPESGTTDFGVEILVSRCGEG